MQQCCKYPVWRSAIISALLFLEDPGLDEGVKDEKERGERTIAGDGLRELFVLLPAILKCDCPFRLLIRAALLFVGSSAYYGFHCWIWMVGGRFWEESSLSDKLRSLMNVRLANLPSLVVLHT